MSEELNAVLGTLVKQHEKAVSGFFKQHNADLVELSGVLADAFTNGRKLLVCGNGGSACDAMHIAGEFVGRFIKDRRALPAIALTADPGIITAVSNDYAFEDIFSRQIEALGKAGDVLIGISTSGQSANVLKALEAGNTYNLYTVLLTSERCEAVVDAKQVFKVPSAVTAHIQETHIMALQALVSLVEKRLFPTL